MNVYRILVKFVCTEDISNIHMMGKLCDALDSTFVKNKNLEGFHEKNIFKYYTFTQPVPYPAHDKYLKGNVLSFYIQTADPKLKEHFIEFLPGIETNSLIVVTAVANTVPKKPLHCLFTTSPIVLKTEVGYWRRDYGLDYFMDSITNNAIKKYNALTGSNVPRGREIFSSVSFRKEAVKRNYKNIVLIGDHCTLNLKNDSLSQDIGYMLIGAGVGTTNGRGFGTVSYQLEKGVGTC